MNPTSPAPWSRPALLAVLLVNALGLAAIVSGWLLASDRVVWDDQFAAANLSVAGLIVAGGANVAWLLTGWRAVGRVKLALFGPRGDRR